MNNKHLLFILSFICLLSCNEQQKSTNASTLPERFTINNDTLEVSINLLGAELSSIKSNNKEYLWQGDKAYWHEQSPILFPIVGKLKNDKYYYNGIEYNMKFHGFARKEQFSVVNKDNRSITLSLKTNKSIKEQYPFNFELQIRYTIKNNSLEVAYNVINLSKIEPMYFSIGAHPGFICPIEKTHKRNEYELVFDKKVSPNSLDKSGGLFNDRQTQYFKEEGVLKLTDTTFNKGALVFKPNPFNKATLVHKPTGKSYLSVTFKGFPYLGIWSARKPDTPFVCIEPWYGLADFASHNKDLIQKEGIQSLASNSIFKASYRIQIY